MTPTPLTPVSYKSRHLSGTFNLKLKSGKTDAVGIQQCSRLHEEPFYFGKEQDLFTGHSAPKHPNLISKKFTHKMIDYPPHNSI